MLEFMDYVQFAFYNATKWNYENSYSQLTATAKGLLDFETPGGLRFNLSSLSSPNFATSVDEPWMWEQWHGGRRVDKCDTLLYGRLYLPQSTLEALYLRRFSPTQQVRITAVSDSRLRNGGTILALHQYDTGKYSTETLYSTDGGLLGLRGLYNFGPDPRKEVPEPPKQMSRIDDKFYGRFSAGAELYYGTLNKSGGVSVGGRFATLPAHKGIPLTATLTLNPLMGNISSTYADVNYGKMKAPVEERRVRSMEAKLAWKLDEVDVKKEKKPEEVAGVLKAKVDQDLKVGLVWEGRVKELLFTLGTSIDMKRRDQPFRALGLELQYSS
ncbi:hypothetical protein DID88_007357 [Monilinia fructigena]|uniref:Mitochondrial distribution and morphology protein 10 n=1 Tax=Monilinia fructigena TaxID=38457 RepID=A0A395J839_9HELO|nr:hypothetical protein DID88_007357 [Monilinia fructigena]